MQRLLYVGTNPDLSRRLAAVFGPDFVVTFFESWRTADCALEKGLLPCGLLLDAAGGGSATASSSGDAKSLGPETFRFCRSLGSNPRLAKVVLIVLGPGNCRTDVYEAFASGAWDYVTMPIDPLEVKLRLTAHLHRRKAESAQQVLVLGEAEINLALNEARLGGVRRIFTPNEASILGYLLRRRGSCVTTEELLVEALGYEPRLGNPEVVRTHVRHLRQKVEVDPSHPKVLVNVPRVGYRIAIPPTSAIGRMPRSTGSSTPGQPRANLAS